MMTNTNTNTGMNMRRISNRNMISSMDTFEKAMMRGYDIMCKTEGEFKDLAVLTEAFTMASISKNCCDTASANPGSVSFERTPRNRSMIESRLGCMSMEMTTTTYKAKKTRKNMVTQAIMHAIQCFVDISDIISNKVSHINAIVITNILSVTHAAMVTLVFRCMCLNFDWDPDMTLYLIVDEETMTAMKVYVGSKFNVELFPSSDKVMTTFNIISKHINESMYVITHTQTIVDMVLNTNSNRTPYISTLMDMDTYAKENSVLDMYINKDMTIEAMPISDPDMVTVRIATLFTTDDMTTSSYEYLSENMSLIARMRWFNNMIRHMDVDSLCYDCWIAFRVASTIGKCIMHTDEISNIYESRLEYRNFSTVVGSNGMASSS